MLGAWNELLTATVVKHLGVGVPPEKASGTSCSLTAYLSINKQGLAWRRKLMSVPPTHPLPTLPRSKGVYPCHPFSTSTHVLASPWTVQYWERGDWTVQYWERGDVGCFRGVLLCPISSAAALPAADSRGGPRLWDGGRGRRNDGRARGGEKWDFSRRDWKRGG